MLTLTSPCKINLFLHVIGRRADGYHNLQTAFQILKFSDRVSIWDSDTLAVEDLPGVKGEDNLVYRAALLLKQFALENSLGSGSTFGARIAIQKQIPMGAGLGGACGPGCVRVDGPLAHIPDREVTS